MDEQMEEGRANPKMGGTFDTDDENWIRSKNPSNNQVEEEQEDEEALSLCDLPINEENHRSQQETTTPPPKPIVDPQEDFNFCSGGDSSSKESEMCVADVVFFRGQILPMRHSISFDSGMITSRTTSRCLSRSESMDHSSYSVGFTSVSSRSSSINSHHSSSSGSSSATTVPKSKPTPKIKNQFQFSQPSPKPQIRSSNIKNGGHIGTNPNRNSTFWSLLRVGLVTTPEIAMQDLKFRSKSNNSTKNFGSRNSTSSISSSNFTNNSSRIKEADKKQRQRKFFDRNRVFFSGCKCSSNAVVGPIPSRVAINVITRNVSAKGEAHADADEEDNSSAAMKKHNRTRKQHHQAGRQSLSRHRTFEWLKQLSLEAAVVIDEAEQNQQ